ncbi:MAG: TetR/AcrR family transcriptional regulator [Gammaproteobacteria bacterium]|nr:TetR/AcrR family transcriptional regulator [Gammaproteobacteria bacterium]
MATGNRAQGVQDERGTIADRQRRPRGVQARLKLKNAAQKVLERKGYHQMRVSDVTREAGFATGLFYHYFPDLKTLTLEVLTDFVQRFEAMDDIEQGLAKDDTYGRILAHMRVFVESYARNPGLMRCMVQLSDEVPEFRQLFQQSAMRQFRWLATQVPRYFPNADLGCEEALLLVYTLGSMSESVLREYYVSRDPALRASKMKNEDMAELIAALFYRGLFLENPPAERLNFGLKLENVQRAKMTAKE